MVKKELNFLWSGEDFKTKDYYEHNRLYKSTL